jgi:hypothetical protein
MQISQHATLHHTSIVVNDLEKTAADLAKTLSVSWPVWTIAPAHCFVNGEASPFSFKVAFAQIGETNLELIAPHTGNSVYHAHLQQKGEGYHHCCITYADFDTLQNAKNELIKQGHKLIQQGYTEGVFEFCYFELLSPKVLLEILFIKELPPPEKIIGEQD